MVANHAKPNGTPTPATTAARLGGFSAEGWSAGAPVQFPFGITFKGGDVEVEEREENLEEVDTNVESEEEAEKADDNW